jgi:hypothetical protein
MDVEIIDIRRFGKYKCFGGLATTCSPSLKIGETKAKEDESRVQRKMESNQ